MHFLGGLEVLEIPTLPQPSGSPGGVGSPKVLLSLASLGIPREAGGLGSPYSLASSRVPTPATNYGPQRCPLPTPPQPSEAPLPHSRGVGGEEIPPSHPCPGCPFPTHPCPVRCARNSGPGAFESCSSVAAGQHWPSLAQSECEAMPGGSQSVRSKGCSC